MLRCLRLLYPGFEKEQPKHLDLLKSSQNVNPWGEGWGEPGLVPIPHDLLVHSALCAAPSQAHNHHFCPGPKGANRA